MTKPNDMGDAPSGPGLSAPEGAPIPIAGSAATHQALDVEDLKDCLVAASEAVADQDERAAQSFIGEALKLLNKVAP